MKNISTRVNRFIAMIADIIEKSVLYMSEDPIILVFLVATLVPNIILKITSDLSLFNLRSILFNFMWFALIVAWGYKFNKKRGRAIYYSIMTFIVYALAYSNIMYFRYYESFLSISLVRQLKLFKDVAGATTVGMSLMDIFYWGSLILSIVAMFVISYHKFFMKRMDERAIRKPKKNNFYKLALLSLISGVLTLAPSNYSQAEKMWNRPLVVDNFGLYNYHFIDIFKSIGVFFQPKVTEADYDQFMDYFNTKNAEPSYSNVNDYTNILKGQNVIVIHAESLQNFLINSAFNGTDFGKVGEIENGQEITPYFNQIANGGLYFNDFFSQQSIGTSADSEFVFNTSLLPINSGTVYLNNYTFTYDTTQTILRDNNYYTMYMHGNSASFWNRKLMAPVMGYDIFYSKDEAYTVNDSNTIGLGISDYAFFEQSMEYLKAADSSGNPYYATLITLSNHTPWGDVKNYVTYDESGNEAPQIDCGDMEGTTVCRYLKSVHYSDWAFGQFMKMLSTQGMLDDTAIVIYGDHPAALPIAEMEELYHHDLSKIENKVDDRVPFIIYSNKIAPQEITKVMGEFDVGPTLQNMLGVTKNSFALGNDIFSVNTNLVPFINGDWTDGNIYYDAFKDDYVFMNDSVTDADITDDYIKERNDQVTSMIDMSNLINRLDLIKVYNEKQNGTSTTGGS